ncbi:LOW QUALITY PROTEIN: telethonin [Cinclus cinclus]|uniref:LOW QUALITY PROTEIN: telethonin n=1 Tax=Cinclus cinclus TaxID=127875 RepID=UPI002E10FA40
MVGPGVVGSSKGLLSARLGCQVQEEDVGRRETFSAEWLDLELRSRPEDGWCRREVDTQHRETLEQRGAVRVLEQRSPWGLLRVGVLGQPLTQHLLPYARTFPVPLFAPLRPPRSKGGNPRTLSRSLSHEAQRGLSVAEGPGKVGPAPKRQHRKAGAGGGGLPFTWDPTPAAGIVEAGGDEDPAGRGGSRPSGGLPAAPA